MAGFPHMTPRILLSFAIGLSMLLAGCGDFNDGKTANIIQGSPVRLDAEQVMLSDQQVGCGVDNELWDPPSQGGTRTIARLTQKARDLKFDDDVSVREGGYRSPYVQVRGEFPLSVISIESTRDGPEQDTKLVEVRVGVKIDHPCFPNPLPLMGLRKGQFTEDYPPVFEFRYYNNWQFEKVVH
jgi:hypothetical protein